METTFMTIHDLSPDARILYATVSIVDILGFSPEEVINRSSFDYFHPDEVPFARGVHERGIRLDKASVLHYARILNRDGDYISCECVFSIVYNVLVACTSIYRADEKSMVRASQAPAVRRLFSSSPRDPRYHMLEHLSSRFRAPPQYLNEPRAALILNRFTRELPVLYATEAVESILGVTAEQFQDKSFYECITDDCQPAAIRALESAKANDSIAYLRFRYRDPRRPEDFEDDQAIRDASASSDSDDGGVELNAPMDIDPEPVRSGSSSKPGPSRTDSNATSGDDKPIHSASPPNLRTTSSSESSYTRQQAASVFDRANVSRSSTSSLAVDTTSRSARSPRIAAAAPVDEGVEIEAIVSCTSDGLVVIIRRARELQPNYLNPNAAANPSGLFAAPWGANPIHPHVYEPQPQPFQHGFNAPLIEAGGPPQADFMNAIREVAVFAWSLAGINGNLTTYGHGTPRGEAQPRVLPVWDPYAQPRPSYSPPWNQAQERWSQRDEKRDGGMGRYSRVPRIDYNYGSKRRSLGSGYVFQGPGGWVSNGFADRFRNRFAEENVVDTVVDQAAQGHVVQDHDQNARSTQNTQVDDRRGRYLWY